MEKEPIPGRALRTPPHNIEAEKKLLGTILVNNRAYELMSNFLRPEHFALTQHGRIFKAQAALIERGQVADPVTLLRYFEQDETLAEIGGPAYLSELANSPTTAINAGEYGRIVYELYLKRELSGLGEDVITKAYDGSSDATAADIIVELQSRLDQLAGECQRGATNRSRALSWPELAALPPAEYLVKGVLEKGSLAEIYGPWGSGKSFLSVDIGIHIAMGREWNGRKVRQAGVLYVSVEAGRGIRYRLEAFQRHHGLDLVDVPFFVVTEPTSLLEPTGVAQVLADASRVPNLGLIVIDTAARVAGGDEGAENFSLLVSACDHIRAATDVNLTMVHHAGKDSSRGSRGSTVLPAAADTIIEVTRDKTTKISTAKIEKQRDGEAGPLLNFNLKVIETGTDADGDTISSCVVEPTDQKPAKSTTPKQRRALKVLHNVLVDHGSRAPNTKHYPSGAIVTDVGLWREYLEKAGVLDAHASNPRTPFKRLRDGMIDRGLIGEWDGLVWAVRDK